MSDGVGPCAMATEHLRLRRLEVESFKCVDSAQIEFGPGLNVLFGPNDLGKSSLGEAIRAVLLLPATSSERKVFEAWGATRPTRVRLVFAHHGGLWRVDKTWGEGNRGTALLERSGDGHVWSKIETGRSVDAELRKMLGWGVREPGGKGAPKGLPRSFITTALLGANSRIEELFADSLADDSDPAGRERLSQALQSLAEDPLFKRILTIAQDNVDRSKDSRGNWRRGREAPLGRIGERIRELAAEHDALQRQAEQSESVHELLRRHHEQRVAIAAQLESAGDALAGLRAAFEAGGAWRQAEAARDAMRSRVESIDADLARVERLRDEAEAARRGADAAIELAQRASAAVAEAEQAQRSAQEVLAALERDDGAQARIEELRRRGLTIAQRRQQLGERRARLGDALTLDRTAGTEARRADEASAAARRAELELGAIRDEVATIDRSLAQLEGWAALWAWREATATAERTEQAAAHAKATAARARLLREGAARRRAELDRAPVPDAAMLEQLRELDVRLRRAQDQAAVGFAVTLLPSGDRPATIVADGGDPATAVGGATTHAARRDMTIELPPWGSLRIEAGSATLRDELNAARARWDSDGAPILAAHGATSLDALVAASQQWHEQARRCELDEQQAAAAEREAAASAVDEGTLLAVRTALQRATRALGVDDPAALATRVEQLEAGLGHATADEVRARHDALRTKHDARAAALAQRELERGLAVAEAARAQLDAQTAATRADAARAGLGADLVTALAECDDELAALEQGVQEIEREIADAAGQGQRATAGARAQLDAATLAVTATKSRRIEIEAQLTRAREGAAAAAARADEATTAVAGHDRDALIAELARLESELGRLGRPTTVVTADDLAVASDALARLEQQRREIDAEIQKAEGSLEQIGGQTMRRRADETQALLLEAKQSEADLQRDFEGWQLLRDTLRAVETEQGQHLGNALGTAVEARLERLTAGRYTRLDLDRDLRAQGLRVAGSPRAIEVLSAGLKEQLATLVRLAVAEHLGAAVILDDHLAQTDPERVEFFRALLREVGDRVQIVVLTCRPLDYLGEGELDAVRGVLDVGPSLRAVDLQGSIQRSNVTEADQDRGHGQ